MNTSLRPRRSSWHLNLWISGMKTASSSPPLTRLLHNKRHHPFLKFARGHEGNNLTLMHIEFPGLTDSRLCQYKVNEPLTLGMLDMPGIHLCTYPKDTGVYSTISVFLLTKLKFLSLEAVTVTQSWGLLLARSTAKWQQTPPGTESRVY